MNFKKKVHIRCLQLVDERLAMAKKLIEEAQAAANQDAKSSMGDKYETSREMMALEMRKAGEQIEEATKLKRVLSELNPDLISDKIVLGSLISTSIGNFYLSVSLGQLQVNGKDIFVLSAVSPLGNALLLKCKGDTLIFNSKTIEIRSIA